MMRVRFWGTRGSLPVAPKAANIRGKLVRALLAADGRRFDSPDAAGAFVDSLTFSTGSTYGGATSCVEVEGGDGSFVICDLGSGLRECGQEALRRCAAGAPRVFHLFLSHLHWDHIMGFPFFGPAYDPAARIIIYSCHADAECALRRQQEEVSFPVPFDHLAAQIEFVTLLPGQTRRIAGFDVTAIAQYHSHQSYGYRFDDGVARLVYSTDSEHRGEQGDAERAFLSFIANADLVICDTMYSLAEAVSLKADWGHSNNLVAVDLCRAARARQLMLFHHEPLHSDRAIAQIHRDTIRYEQLTREAAPPLDVLCAYDGLVMPVAAAI